MVTNKSYSVNYQVQAIETVKTDCLDPIEYAYRQSRPVLITIRQPEFTSVCPMTGLPDYGTIIIEYIPGATIIELKSLKYYLLQYRNVGIFYEHLVNRILDDLVKVIDPRWMKVEGVFTARGGITSQVAAEHGEKL